MPEENQERRTVQRARTFRIFVSSTFADMKAERDALQREVFPKLRQLCLQHGCRFQAIDLRWGVSEEASRDQQTMNVCIEELKRCQQVTPRPNFIVLLGDRYGWRPLPPQIEAGEFEETLSALEPDDQDRLLWDERQPDQAKGWYRRDDNAVPAEYCLRPRQTEAAHGATEKEKAAALAGEAGEWEQVERRLRVALLRGIDRLGQPAGDPRRAKYEASATHQEAVHGALSVPDAGEHVFCYFREIEHLPDDEKARDFVDLDPCGRRDKEAGRQLGRLKSELSLKAPDNIRVYRTEWADDQPTCDYIAELCEDVYKDLSRIIVQQIESLEEIGPLDQEIESHRGFARERARHFVGRHDFIARIHEYVTGSEKHPLVVHGVSGSGKSALMARCAEVLRERDPDSVVICRFIGATPASTDIRFLLESLVREIGRAYGDEAAPAGEHRELVQEFQNRLSVVSPGSPLVVLVDALDQLSPSDNARTLNWLPRELPDYVRLIVSVLEAEGTAGECLRAARSKLPEDSFLELRPLTSGQGAELLDRWLRAAGRCLQPAQRADILAKFARCPLPLYLKLAFDEARQWKSYDALPCGADEEPGLSPDVEGIIRDMLARLEAPANHGRAVTSGSLAYLAAARNGLTEDELLDLLSADQEVMADFKRRSPRSPDVDRLPVIVWSRLYSDLEHHLSEHSADHTSLLGFYHRQVGEAVARRYLDEESTLLRHERLADYFLSQPHKVSDADGNETPDYRKMSELAYHLLEAEQSRQLAELLSDFDFVAAKLEARMVYDLVGDYNAALARRAGDGVDRELHETLAAWADFVAAESHNLSVLRLGLSPVRGSHSFLFQQAYNSAASGPVAAAAQSRLDAGRGPRGVWLRRVNRPRQVTRPPGERILEGPMGAVWRLALTSDGRLVAGGWLGELLVWDVATGEWQWTLEGHTDHLHAIALAPDGRLASASHDGTVRIWDLSNGECQFVLRGHHGKVWSIAFTPNGQLLSGGEDSTLRLWDLDSGECLAVLEGHSAAVYTIGVVDDTLAASGSADRTLRLWHMTSGRCERVLEGHAGEVGTLVTTADGRLVSGSSDGTLRVWDPTTGVCEHVLTGHTGTVWTIVLTADGRALSCSDDKTLRVWDLGSGTCEMVLQGHTRAVGRAALMPDGRAVSCSDDQTLRVWNLTTGSCEWVSEESEYIVADVVVTREGKVISAGGSLVRIWSVGAQPPLEDTTAHSAKVTRVCVSNADLAVSTSVDGTLKVWDVSQGTCLHALAGHVAPVWAAAIAPDGRLAASAGEDATLRLWDVRKGLCRQVVPLEARPFPWLDMMPDGEYVAVTDPVGSIVVWHPPGPLPLRILEGAQTPARLVPPGWLISASESDALTLWELSTGNCLATLEGHTDHVVSLLAMPDYQVLSLGVDRTLRVWDLRRLECTRRIDLGCLDARGDADPELLEHVSAILGLLSDTEVAVRRGAGRAEVWDIGTGRLVSTIAAGDPGRLAPGRRLLYANFPMGLLLPDQWVRLVDLSTGRVLAELDVPLGPMQEWGCTESEVTQDGVFMLGLGSGDVQFFKIEG